ncbi:MAG: hypothetical protein NVSMB49_15410 [Ktedonobacteraceae bacterium]
MEQCQRLRVLIVGQQNNFNHVLSLTIQHWGYEVVRCSPEVLWREEAQQEACSHARLAERQADVLLYDLDDVVEDSKSYVSSDTLYLLKERKQLLIVVLSSRSVSRKMLEQIGAIALLQKPFEMGRLLRYLRVFQQLLHSHAQQQTQTSLRNTRVLVADDDRNIAAMIRQCLISDVDVVFDVAIAYDGLDALEQCLAWQPHCIVTDLMMPLMNGYQVMRCLALGASHTSPAFVVMSALTQLEAPADTSYLAGKAVAYVNKPFHIDSLLAAIQQVSLVEHGK